jgi:hypothetical protein
MKNILVKFIFMCFSVCAIAEVEFSQDSVQISRKYYSGQFLIYDCASKHWVCVDKDGYEGCRVERDSAKKDFETNLKCSPIKEFKNQKECVEFQRHKTHHPESTKYCIHQDLRKGITR